MLIYNIVLVSGISQSDSVRNIHTFLLFQILFPFRLLKNSCTSTPSEEGEPALVLHNTATDSGAGQTNVWLVLKTVWKTKGNTTNKNICLINCTTLSELQRNSAKIPKAKWTREELWICLRGVSVLVHPLTLWRIPTGIFPKAKISTPKETMRVRHHEEE